MKKLSKILSVLIAGLLCTSLLAGCGSTTAGSPAATPATPKDTAATGEKSDSIRVVTFFAGSDQWAPVWKEVVDEYMTANPGVTIVDESQPTSGANDLFRTKVQADIAAKTPADLMLFFNGADGTTVMDSELFVDMKPFMDDDAAWAANLKESAMKAGQADGVQYCIPYIGYFEGLLYNKGLFDKYSLAEPTSWENILACIDTFNQNGVTPLAISMAKPSYMCELFILSQVGVDGQKKYFDASWAPAMNSIKTLYEKKAFPPDTMTMSEDDIRMMFSDEKAAMMINGSWTISALKDNENMRMIAMPTLPGGVGGENTALSGFGSGWYMSKAAAERDDATLKFLKYMTSPEIMTRFIAIGGSPSVTCQAADGATPLEVSALEMLNKATFQDCAVDSQVAREAWLTLAEPGMQYIVEGKRTAEDVLAQAKGINDAG